LKNLGAAYFTLGEWEKCIHCFISAEGSGSGGFKMLWYLGEVHSACRDHNKVAEKFREATEDNPTDSQSWIGLAGAYKAQGNYDRAISALSVGIAKNPSDPWFWKILGETYMAKKNYNKAIESFKTAAEMNPADSRIRLGLGEALDSSGDLEGAIDIFKWAIEKFPTVARLWKCLGEALETKGDLREAQIVFKAASVRFPSISCRRSQSPEPGPLAAMPSHPWSQTVAAPPITRSVWLFTRETQPLSVRYSHKKSTPLSDWAVLVSAYSRTGLEDQVRSRSCQQVDVNESWGELHELVNHSGTPEYQSHESHAGQFNSSGKLDFQGEVAMTNEELGTIGMVEGKSF
jgi:tetratricopeptide (TPR) repeat protein